MAEIKPVLIEITKRDLEIKESGLEGGKITSNRTTIVRNEQSLPDILVVFTAGNRTYPRYPC